MNKHDFFNYENVWLLRSSKEPNLMSVGQSKLMSVNNYHSSYTGIMSVNFAHDKTRQPTVDPHL